jgi:hypothetical protein
MVTCIGCSSSGVVKWHRYPAVSGIWKILTGIDLIAKVCLKKFKNSFQRECNRPVAEVEKKIGIV